MAISGAAESFPRVSLRVLSIFLLAFYAAWALRVMLLMPIEAGIDSYLSRQIISQSVRIALWGIPVYLMVRYVHQVPVLSGLRMDTLPKGRAALDTTIICVGWLVITALFGVLVEGKSLIFARHPTISQWAGIAVTIIWAPILEEILFRGYVYQALRNHMGWVSAALASGLLFAAAHWAGWLYMQGPHLGLVTQTAAITVIGAVLAAVFERGQSLWPCIVLHTLNNLLWAGPAGT